MDSELMMDGDAAQECKLRVWTHLDRSGWPEHGQADVRGEPDRAQWVDPETGFACLMVRHSHFGHWCGYVGVPPGHAAHGAHYDRVERAIESSDEDPWISVHGGLTFADKCSEKFDEESGRPLGVCHIAEPGTPDDVWWFGFDCGHSGDTAPATDRLHREWHASYKTARYVVSEVRRLARQLVGAGVRQGD